MHAKYLIIIPTFNESRNIKNLIAEIHSLTVPFDILVIDDNSPDGTGALVKKIAASDSFVHLIERDRKRGLGTAYRLGFQWALDKGYSYIFTMDADFSHPPSALCSLAQELSSHDIVMGSRYIPGGGVAGWPLRRLLLSRFGSVYARLVTGIPVHDCTSGMMGLTAGAVREVLKENISSEGYSFLLELKHILWRKGCRMKEVPIVFVDRVAGVSKISKKIIFEAMCVTWLLRFKRKK